MSTIFKFATTVFQPHTTNPAADASAAVNSRTHTAPEATATPITRQDTTALSASSALSAAASIPDASRAARIESLRQSIAAGTYYVPAHEVASAIIHSLL